MEFQIWSNSLMFLPGRLPRFHRSAPQKEEEAAEENKEEEATEEKKAEEAKAAGEDKKEDTKAEEAAPPEVAGEGEKPETPVPVVDKDFALWGEPLLPSKGDEATDVVLLKFPRARDFKAGAAFEMLRKTLRWRREWKSIAATAADYGGADADAVPEGARRLDSADREGHPACYNAVGVFVDDTVYSAALANDEGKGMEHHVTELDFALGGVASLLQVTDLKGAPGPG